MTAKTQIKNKKKEFDIDSVIPARFQTAASLVILFILFLIFYAPMYFGGKTFESGDIVTSKSLTTYITSHQDGFTLWNPYVFCGMPAYAMGVGFKWFNLIYVGVTAFKWLIKAFASVEYATWSLYLILLAYTSYFLMKYLTRNTLVSIFTAIAASFCTGLVVFLYLGHVTKLTSICMYPLIFLILLKFQQKIKLLDVAILVIALQLFVQGWHVQIIFYTVFAVGVYFIYYIIRSIVNKESRITLQLLKSAGVFVGCFITALLIQSDNLTQIYEYSPYSTRGAKSVVETKGNAHEEPASGSAYYEYHTEYSFSPGEVMTFIIPSFYGFGNSTYNGPISSYSDVRVNTYFGQMLMVDAPMYMGVLVFFFALFAIFTCWKDPFVQFLTILSVFSLLVSFGKTFSPVFDLMFYYFPYFDKFRVPSMMLVLVQLSMPFLAGLGVNKIISLRNEKDIKTEKLVKFAAIGFGVLFVLSVVLSGVLNDWFAARMIASDKARALMNYYQSLSDYAASMFVSDMMIAFALCALAFGLVQAYIKSKINSSLLVIAILVFTLTDLWRIDSRGTTYTEAQNLDAAFVEPEYVRVIKGQKDTSPFRIVGFREDGSHGNADGSNADFNAYFLLQDLYGYSGIKPRGYQDIIDVVGSAANPTLWRMLNVKYIILSKPVNYPGLTEISRSKESVVYRNETALPRAYFVNTVQTKPALQILNLIKDNGFDPKETAFLEEGSLKVDRPDTAIASVEVIKYKDEHITINAKATGNNFLFLGDTYFPKGWKALIDGNETKIYQVNHNFRGIVVPKGEHKVEFIYAPESFYVSRILSLSLSSLVIIGVILGLLFNRRKPQENQEKYKTS